MSLKSNLLVLVMVIGGLGSAPLMAEAQIGNVRGLPPLMKVEGTVYCTADGNIGNIDLAYPIPFFTDARVEILGFLFGRALPPSVTDDSGSFSMYFRSTSLSSVLTDSTIMVSTPLSNCNSTLPSTGFLSSTLEYNGTVVEDGNTIMTLVPKRFRFSPSP
ncbi:phylloplanin [Cucumis sativus]|uniref:Uncharacterized protein n=1 Tax=Cucumis sativus TaxID=3659 RepID=A0A0A0L921_CUCSA|nr:phylloplanin [Cucumis sativus]KGN57122.1 hypothetical protein Csa_010875 [Cucumis sativus]